jgi:hypothetical protein
VTAAIAGTCADFRRLFNDRDMMSAFVVWAVAELEAFATIFQRQVWLAFTMSRLERLLVGRWDYNHYSRITIFQRLVLLAPFSLSCPEMVFGDGASIIRITIFQRQVLLALFSLSCSEMVFGDGASIIRITIFQRRVLLVLFPV